MHTLGIEPKIGITKLYAHAELYNTATITGYTFKTLLFCSGVFCSPYLQIIFWSPYDIVLQTHAAAEPLKTPADNEDEVKGAAEISADESVVGPEETASAAETLAAVQPARETAAGDVEAVIDAAVEVNEPAVEVVGGPVVEAEPMTVEAEPLDIHTVAEVTEVSDTMHVHCWAVQKCAFLFP